MNQILRLTVLLVALVALAGCGDDSEDQARAKALLREAFGNSIGSANVSVDLTADLDGNAQFKQPVRIKLAGPYQSNPDGKLPDADWDVSISGGGQTFSVGLLTTEDRAFVRFQGTAYDLGRKTVDAIQGPPPRPGTKRQSLTQRLGVDLLEWVDDAKIEDDAEVAGVPTEHVEASLDVGKALRGLNTIVKKAGSAAPRAARVQLSDKQIDSFREYVDDPRFDVYVGKVDRKIRRVSIDLEFEVPEDQQKRVGGIEGGTITLDVELAAVGQPQRIEVPQESKPISELTKQLGGLGIFGALFGGGATGPTGPSGPSGTPPSADQFQKYAECLDRLKPDDRNGMEQCSALLR